VCRAARGKTRVARTIARAPQPCRKRPQILQPTAMAMSGSGPRCPPAFADNVAERDHLATDLQRWQGPRSGCRGATTETASASPHVSRVEDEQPEKGYAARDAGTAQRMPHQQAESGCTGPGAATTAAPRACDAVVGCRRLKVRPGFWRRTAARASMRYRGQELQSRLYPHLTDGAMDGAGWPRPWTSASTKPSARWWSALDQDEVPPAAVGDAPRKWPQTIRPNFAGRPRITLAGAAAGEPHAASTQPQPQPPAAAARRFCR